MKDKREWLINPGVDIPAEATAVHGVTSEHARAARPRSPKEAPAMSMTEPQFGQLPPTRGSQRDLAGAADALRQRRGEWALIGSYSSQGSASSMVSNIKRAVSSTWEPRGAFEAVTRGNDVWARYVGEVTP